MTNTNLKASFEQQFSASRSMPAPDANLRRDRLERLERLLIDNTDSICTAISTDFGGRSVSETKLLELLPAVRGIHHARHHVARWMKDERRPVDVIFQPSKAWVRYEPLGVVGIISPWNYPLLLAVSPLTDAIAAGNRALIKPSELTPAFAELLARLVGEHFAPEEVAVIPGDVEVAKAFAALPFDHLFFTGSTNVGRSVMRAAAENLTPVTLELGGKSPAIVAEDYPLEKAVQSIAFGKFVNAGQTCIAPDYVLVPRDKLNAFSQAFIKRAKEGYPDVAGNKDYSAIITDRHRDRLVEALDEVRQSGSEILSHESWTQNSRQCAPTLVIDPPPTSLLMREEIFGPVLPVIGYDSLDEALALVTGKDRPLALYLFTHDRKLQENVLSRATSGGVTVNGTLLHIAQEGLPFGGIGPSGIGAYHGREGFKRLSHARAVYKVGPINGFEWFGPPWGLLSRLALRLLGGIR
jgi:coniferyl-aldehyde dehydrogenase